MPRDCGACGYSTCDEFFNDNVGETSCFLGEIRKQSNKKLIGLEYDFRLDPLPGEPTARKSIVPFRPDLVEKWNISPGDYVVGRPAGAGCPVAHCLQVISADPITGVIETYSVGPMVSRSSTYHEVGKYHVHAFEGAVLHSQVLQLGKRYSFLPSLCMINLVHTAVLNTVLGLKQCLRVRLEDIIIL